MKDGLDLVSVVPQKGSSNEKNNKLKNKWKTDRKRYKKKAKNDEIVVDDKRLLMREKRKLRRAKMKVCALKCFIKLLCNNSRDIPP